MKKRLLVLPFIVIFISGILAGCATTPTSPPTNGAQQAIVEAEKVLNGIGIALAFAPSAVQIVCQLDVKNCLPAQQILNQANNSYKVAKDVLAAAKIAGTNPTSISAYAQALSSLISCINDINDLIISFGGDPLPTSQLQLKKAKLNLKRIHR